MLFDNFFSLMSPGVTFGLLAGIVGVFTAVTAMYVRWEANEKKCLPTDDLHQH